MKTWHNLRIHTKIFLAVTAIGIVVLMASLAFAPASHHKADEAIADKDALMVPTSPHPPMVASIPPSDTQVIKLLEVIGKLLTGIGMLASGGSGIFKLISMKRNKRGS